MSVSIQHNQIYRKQHRNEYASTSVRRILDPHYWFVSMTTASTIFLSVREFWRATWCFWANIYFAILVHSRVFFSFFLFCNIVQLTSFHFIANQQNMATKDENIIWMKHFDLWLRFFLFIYLANVCVLMSVDALLLFRITKKKCRWLNLFRLFGGCCCDSFWFFRWIVHFCGYHFVSIYR